MLLALELKCLALHIKTDNKLPANFSKRTLNAENRKDLNRLTVGGKFTRVEMSAWLGSVFEVPKSLAEGDRVLLVHESIVTRQKVLSEFTDE